MAEVHGSCAERFEGVRDALAQQLDDGEDLVLGAPFRWGMGFCLGSPVVPYVPEGRNFSYVRAAYAALG